MSLLKDPPPTLPRVHDPHCVPCSRLYWQIKAFVAENGFSPSHREMMELTGMSSVSIVAYHLKALADRGWVTLTPGLTRTVRPVEVLA